MNNARNVINFSAHGRPGTHELTQLLAAWNGSFDLFVQRVGGKNANDTRSVDISSDGKLLYYSVYTSESDIWLLDLE